MINRVSTFMNKKHFWSSSNVEASLDYIGRAWIGQGHDLVAHRHRVSSHALVKWRSASQRGRQSDRIGHRGEQLHKQWSARARQSHHQVLLVQDRSLWPERPIARRLSALAAAMRVAREEYGQT